VRVRARGRTCEARSAPPGSCAACGKHGQLAWQPSDLVRVKVRVKVRVRARVWGRVGVRARIRVRVRARVRVRVRVRARVGLMAAERPVLLVRSAVAIEV
tara:strand:- start:57 stop:356 length:300 start_codon:yes stop_codon:yes gene_type:complete